MEKTSDPPKEPTRKFSFLVDQECQRKKDEVAAAAAAKNTYTPGPKDYILFVYFCINVLLIGSPLTNSNAVMKVWKGTETFIEECGNRERFFQWSPEQTACSKVALLLFQSAFAATSMIGGVLVDTFSASMCLLIAHIMYGGGSYLFRESGTRGISLGLFFKV